MLLGQIQFPENRKFQIYSEFLQSSSQIQIRILSKMLLKVSCQPGNVNLFLDINKIKIFGQSVEVEKSAGVFVLRNIRCLDENKFDEIF